MLSLFQGPGGDVSSKRVSALGLIICGVVVGFMDHQAVAMASLFVGTGAALLGVQAITKT